MPRLGAQSKSNQTWTDFVNRGRCDAGQSSTISRCALSTDRWFTKILLPTKFKTWSTQPIIKSRILENVCWWKKYNSGLIVWDKKSPKTQFCELHFRVLRLVFCNILAAVYTPRGLYADTKYFFPYFGALRFIRWAVYNPKLRYITPTTQPSEQQTLVPMTSQFVHHFAGEWQTIVSLHNCRKCTTQLQTNRGGFE